MMRLSAWILCCATLLLTLLFIANTLSPERLQNNFSSINITQSSYTNCEVALSLIVGQDITLRGALSPNTHGFVDKDEPCMLLGNIYSASEKSEADLVVADNTLRLRYIWGFRAIQGMAVSMLNVSSVQSMVAILTFAAIVLIGLLTFRRDAKSAACLAPFLFGGAAFSGALDTSALPIAIAYLWAWLAALLLIKAYDNNRDKEFCTVAGMVSAFLWFMEGHFILLVALIGLITYLLSASINSQVSSHKTSNHYAALKRAIRNIIYAHLGFILTTIIFAGLKIAVFGLDATMTSFNSAITHRSSGIDNNGLNISLASLAHRLLFVGFQFSATYQSVWLWKTILVSSFIVLLGLVGYASFNAHRITYSAHYFILLTLIAVYLAIRLLITPNHTYIHALLMSRYLIIPIASIWSFAIYLALTKEQKT